ncbi:MAG: SH3 domain-containing protein [Desulfarculaceae bacterium]|nr:SH3 domain-containing protein [Desulfarculaceae bacterium]
MINPKTISRTALALLLAALLVPLAAPPALAQRGGNGHGGGYGGGRGGGPGNYQGPKRYDRMPKGYQRFNYRGRPYYRHGGGYYRPYRGGFRWVLPPVGMFVAALPVGFGTVYVGGLPYFLYGGVYYRPYRTGYVVVSAPVVGGTVVTPAPAAPSAPASGTVVVLSEALNLRSGPGMGYNVVAVLSQNTALELQSRSNGWLYVRAPGGQMGWVARQFTSDSTPVPSG